MTMTFRMMRPTMNTSRTMTTTFEHYAERQVRRNPVVHAVGVEPMLWTRRWYSRSVSVWDRDYFETLGVERSFSLSNDDLKSSYKSLMTELHPDRHTLKPTDEQERLNNEASKVSRAYDVLRNPHTRATHLLELLGRPMDETVSGELVGPMFLMEIMELRETIDETSTDDELKLLLNDNDSKIKALSTELSESFQSGDLDTALKLTAMMQYWTRVDETIREKMGAQ